MISFRYHIVSIVAIFLAVALGVVVGTTALNGPITDDLRHQVTTLTDQRNAATAQNDQLQGQVADTDTFAQIYGGKVVAGALTRQKVLVLGLPGASESVEDTLVQQLGQAGATVTGRLQLTSSYTDASRTGDIVSLATGAVHPTGLTYPQTSDPGILGGALLSYVLLGKGSATDLSQVLAGFAQLHMLTNQMTTVAPARLVMVVTAGGLPPNDSGGQLQLSLVTQLQVAGGRVVVAGDNASADSAGLVSLVRSDDGDKSTVSTVDDVDTSLGRLSAVLALAGVDTGTVGHFGSTRTAQSLFPEPPR